MKFSRWLNALTFIDHCILAGIFLLALYLAYQTLRFFQQAYNRLQEDNRYAKEMRLTPFAVFSLALVYTFLIYITLGPIIKAQVLALF